MQDDALSDLRPLLRPNAAEGIRIEGRLATYLPDVVAPTTKRFEGFYGATYTRVIRAPAVRRTIFRLWGSADPLRIFEAFVADAVHTATGRPDAVLVDLPSGGGTLLPLLERERFRGTVVEVDLAASMIARALQLHDSLRPEYNAVFLRGDALALPLRDAIADVVISVNGLHVVGDPELFLSEIARVTKPEGRLWIITPVAGPSIRSRLILGAANALSITPGTPPTRAELRTRLDAAGFDEMRDYGGESIAGFGLRRRPT